jgi:hypothetical protein
MTMSENVYHVVLSPNGGYVVRRAGCVDENKMAHFDDRDSAIKYAKTLGVKTFIHDDGGMIEAVIGYA